MGLFYRREKKPLADSATARVVASTPDQDASRLISLVNACEYAGEIAEALELSPGSVGTTLSRARRRLVESYEALQKSREEREKHAAS